MGQLEGKVAIVTGGARGIGKGIAEAFAAEGCAVVIAARSEDRLKAAAEEMRAGGAWVEAVPADVTDEGSVRALFARTLELFGRLDILVNNAGLVKGGRIDELSLDEWQVVMDTNVTGAFLCTREAFRIMKDAGGGRIINIGSISAQVPRPNSAPYTTSKHAIWGLTKSTALDGRAYGIVASCIHPGNVQVDRSDYAPPPPGFGYSGEPLMTPAEVGRVALLMVTLPPDVNLLEAIVLPAGQKYLGRG
ncbi:MAG: SDR family oxidoreductase [Anaerolineae bacterium]